MYNPTVLSNLMGLVNWKQEKDAAKMLPSVLTTNRSGLLFNSIHALLTHDNLRSIFQSKEDSLDEWVNTTTYKVHDRVKVGTVKYWAIKESTGKSPSTETTYWEKCDDYAFWLYEETLEAIIKTLQDFIRVKQLEGKHLLESKTLFDGVGNIHRLNANTGQFVGFEINLPRSKGITVKIEKIGIQCTQVGKFNLYLFHSSVVGPIKTIELDVQNENSINWITATDLNLYYQGSNTDAGGAYYLGYLENEMQGLSINKNYDFENACNVCGGGFNLMSKYISIRPFKVNQDNVVEIWDKDSMIYYATNNWGLNLQLSIHCDISTTISEQEDIFKDLVQIGVAKYFLRKLAFNPNANIDKKIRNYDTTTLLYEIDGNTEGRKTGIGLDYDNAMKAINLETRNLSNICFPCKKVGVNYTSVR